MSKKWQTIYIKDETLEKLKNLEVEMWWLKLDTHDQKILHLIWFYEHYKNNNIKN